MYILHLCKYIAICSIDDIGDNLDRFDFFFLRLTVYQVLKFVFLHCHENSYLLFQFPFQLNFIYIFSFHLTMITKPPREPQGYQRYRTSGRGTTANQMKKEKTTSISKHVDDHNTTGMAQVSIRDRFRPCSRDSSGGRTTRKPN